MRRQISAAIKELLKNLDDAQLDLGQAVYEEGLSGQDQSDLKTIVNTITELRDRLMKQKKGGRKMAKEFKVPTNFEQEMEIDEEIEGSPSRSKFADWVKTVLFHFTDMPKRWSVLIPVGADFYEADDEPVSEDFPNLHEWNYQAGFEVFSDPDTIEFTGEVFGLGQWNADTDTVSVERISVEALKSEN